MPPVKIRSGEAFGWLIAVRIASSEKRHERWVFRCICGKEVVREENVVLRALSKDGQNISCCRRCRIARHAEWMRESCQGQRRLARLVGEQRARDMLQRVHIDKDLPEVFG